MTEQARWERVLARDGRMDGAFVYAVRSTGIYCRPSCPSRRPERRKVVFFAAAEAAERAGFRPCRRCRPDRANSQFERIRLACRFIDEHPDDTITLGVLASALHMSPFHLQRTFKRLMGVTPRQYASARRANRLKTILKEKNNVTEALYEAGYGSSSRLYERAPERLGMTPGTYRRGGEGARIGYTIVHCSVGRLLLAATARGVCRISMGEDDGALEKDLRNEYPAAEIRRDANGLRRWASRVVEHLKGEQPDLDLPIDVRATAFQWRVWEALRAIPYGGTRSYSEVARGIGQPKAARAVARACATNPVAIAVPCHRVVRNDGSMGGYRWGIERKKLLLEKERSRRRER